MPLAGGKQGAQINDMWCVCVGGGVVEEECVSVCVWGDKRVRAAKRDDKINTRIGLRGEGRERETTPTHDNDKQVVGGRKRCESTKTKTQVRESHSKNTRGRRKEGKRGGGCWVRTRTPPRARARAQHSRSRSLTLLLSSLTFSLSHSRDARIFFLFAVHAQPPPLRGRRAKAAPPS